MKHNRHTIALVVGALLGTSLGSYDPPAAQHKAQCDDGLSARQRRRLKRKAAKAKRETGK